MLTKDFDAEFAAREPAEFVLCGRKFHAKERVPYSVWRTLLRGERYDGEETPEENDRRLFADLIAPEDLEDFLTLINSNDPDSPTRGQVTAVYAHLMELASGKVQSNEETPSDGS